MEARRQTVVDGPTIVFDQAGGRAAHGDELTADDDRRLLDQLLTHDLHFDRRIGLVVGNVELDGPTPDPAVLVDEAFEGANALGGVGAEERHLPRDRERHVDLERLLGSSGPQRKRRNQERKDEGWRQTRHGRSSEHAKGRTLFGTRGQNHRSVAGRPPAPGDRQTMTFVITPGGNMSSTLTCLCAMPC